MPVRPVIAISSCIMGQRVRYDGEIKHHPDICQHLQQYFELFPICPETEIGLSVPRPAVQLSGNPSHPRMTGRDDNSIDISDLMRNYCKTKTNSLNQISAYIFKSRSPSCGPNNIPVFNHQRIVSDNNRGLFAEAIIKAYPDLPIADETTLVNEQQRNTFIQQILDYYAKQTF